MIRIGAGGRGSGGRQSAVRGVVRDDRAPLDPAGRLLRALLLQILFSVGSERQLMEELEYNLLYRWFVGLGMDLVSGLFNLGVDEMRDDFGLDISGSTFFAGASVDQGVVPPEPKVPFGARTTITSAVSRFISSN